MDEQVRRVLQLTAVLGAGVTAVSALFGGWDVVAGAFAGVLLAIGNVALTGRQVRRLFSGQLTRFSIILFTMKMGLLFAVLFLLIITLRLNPVALSAGFTTLVLAMGLGVVFPHAAGEAAGAE